MMDEWSTNPVDREELPEDEAIAKVPATEEEMQELSACIQAALFKHLSEQKRNPDPMLVKDEVYQVLSEFCKVVSINVESDGLKATAVVEIPGDLARHLALLPKPSISVKFLTEL